LLKVGEAKPFEFVTVQLIRIAYEPRGIEKPTGREAAGESRWTRCLVVGRPTPYGVGLGRCL